MADNARDEMEQATLAAEAKAERGPLTELSAEEALARLRRGQVLYDVRVEKLCFKGAFDQPVRMKGCVLVAPRFEGATFSQEVLFQRCTLELPHFGKENVFAADFSLSGSTLSGAQ